MPKYTDLDPAGTLDGTEVIAVVIPPYGDGDSRQTTTQDIANLASVAAVKVIQVAFSDTTTAITAGTAKVTFRMPYAMTVISVRASLGTTQASGNIFTVDINEGGTTILSTKITIDNGEKTSTTAAIPPVISDAALADDAEMTIDVDQVGNGTAIQGIVTLIGS